MKKDRNRKECFAACLYMVTTGLLTAVILFCLPLTIPRLFGIHIYSVISGSMEPVVPVGSLIYVSETKPQEISEGDMIAFYGARDSSSIITHRVVEQRVPEEEFITKGDANRTEDMNPVPYENYIGKVICLFPGIGKAAEMLSDYRSKILTGILMGAAVWFQQVLTGMDQNNRR